jgi:oligoendopeptidase F
MRDLAVLDRWDTWGEIHAQPAIWSAWGNAFDPATLRDWIADQQVDEIWFCGAGTSAFIGDSYELRALKGSIDDMLIWDRAITSNEVAQIYHWRK